MADESLAELGRDLERFLLDIAQNLSAAHPELWYQVSRHYYGDLDYPFRAEARLMRRDETSPPETITIEILVTPDTLTATIHTAEGTALAAPYTHPLPSATLTPDLHQYLATHTPTLTQHLTPV
jgi:hypothetical protein